MPEFAILFPTAEDKQPGGNPFAPDMFDYRTSNTFNYFSELNPERRRIIGALHDAIHQGENLEALFGVKGQKLEETVKANLEVLNSPLMAAMDRYSPGVMYKAMDFPGLPTGAQRRLLENGIIFSGLFGLLRPDDLIPNYRLGMDTELPGVGKVAHFWQRPLSAALNRSLKGRFVWNLLPAAFQEAWEDQHTYSGMVQFKFFLEQDGELKPVTQGVQTLRGALINYIVRESADSPEIVAGWKHPDGYRLDEEASSWDDETQSGVLVMVTDSRKSATA